MEGGASRGHQLSPGKVAPLKKKKLRLYVENFTIHEAFIVKLTESIKYKPKHYTVSFLSVDFTFERAE